MVDKHCSHGVEGGCEISCENCGHRCKEHCALVGEYGEKYFTAPDFCDAENPDGSICPCEGFEGTPG